MKKIIIGWTNQPPVEIGNQMYQTCIRVCTQQRRGFCTGHDRRCYEMEPGCFHDEICMAGKKPRPMSMIGPTLTAKDKKTIVEKLRAYYEQCHRVNIVVREECPCRDHEVRPGPAGAKGD